MMTTLVRDCTKYVDERYMLYLDEDLIQSVNEHVNSLLVDSSDPIAFTAEDIAALWKNHGRGTVKRLFKLYWASDPYEAYPEWVAYEYLDDLSWNEGYWGTISEEIDEYENYIEIIEEEEK